MGSFSTGGRRRKALLVTAALAAAAGLAPSAARGELSTFGSNLDKPADRPLAEQRDIAYWQTLFDDGRPTTVPFDGQIKKIELRGFAQTTVPPGDPNQPGSPVFFLQALTPEGPTVRARISSAPFYLPGSATGTPDTVTAYEPANFCVKAGEHLSFTGVGGWDGGAPGATPYSDGTPMQVFATVANATVRYFTANEGVKNGALFAPRPGEPSDRLAEEPRAELLMRATIATGDDRSFECGGPNTYRPADPVPTPKPTKTGADGKPVPAKDDPIRAAATIPAGKRASVDSKGFVSVGMYCPSLKPCAGAVSLAAGKTALGKGRFSMAKGKSAGIRFKLSKSGLKFVKRKKYKVTATVTAVTDGAGTQTGKVKLKKRGA